jgi:hypothetical protein
MLATLLKNIDKKKCWQHFRKMLTRKNVGNTFEKMFATLPENVDEKML